MAARKKKDEHLEVLRAIWSEMKGLNGRIDQTNARLDQMNTRIEQTNARLDQTNTRIEQTNARLDEVGSELSNRIERLERRQTEDSVRLATEIVAVAKAIGEVRDLLREDRKLRERIDDHERRLASLERHSA